MSEATKLIDLIDPEVMADMISAKVDKKMVVTLIAKIDNTLVGTPGSTITVPSYNYIGDAEDVAEGVEAIVATGAGEPGKSAFTSFVVFSAFGFFSFGVLGFFLRFLGSFFAFSSAFAATAS